MTAVMTTVNVYWMVTAFSYNGFKYINSLNSLQPSDKAHRSYDYAYFTSEKPKVKVHKMGI
jgi:hypothetical protein